MDHHRSAPLANIHAGEAFSMNKAAKIRVDDLPDRTNWNQKWGGQRLAMKGYPIEYRNAIREVVFSAYAGPRSPDCSKWTKLNLVLYLRAMHYRLL